MEKQAVKSYSAKSKTRTSRDCFNVATVSYDLARIAKSDWEIKHHCVTGVTFIAFSIEAMMNHYGKIYFPDFDSLRVSRIELHKKLFNAVNLKNYLGTENYQEAKKCFELRDSLAHGKTIVEEVFIELPEDTSNNDIVGHMTSIKSKPFRDVSIEMLESFIDAAVKIEKEIEANGYYPGQSHLPVEEREKLLECPLSVRGVSIW